jgi:glycosyltransferase involved in cell wall biosynthesis
MNSSQITIVHLSAYYPPHIGGIQKHLARIAAIHHRQGHQVTILTQQYDAQLPIYETLAGVKVIRLPVTIPAPDQRRSYVAQTRYKLQLWWDIGQHLSILRKADVIHIHDVFFWLLPFLPAVDRHKTFITFHGYEGSQPPKFWQRFWHQVAQKFARGSMGIGGFHQKWYGVSPTITSFGAVELSRFEEKNKTNRHRLANTFIYAGRLEEDTGIMTYLQAFKLLYQENSKYKLDVFGEGSLAKAAKDFVRKHNLPVSFYPFTHHLEKLLAKYQLAFVSRYLTILEALAVGTGVVAHFDNEIKKDYLEGAPFKLWIAIADSPQAIASAVKKMLLKKQVAPSAATRWVRQQTWQVLADQYDKLWQVNYSK